MDDFHTLPIHVQNTLKRAGITTLDQARALGRDGLSRVPGLGPLAMSRILPPAAPQAARNHLLAHDEARRVKRWFDALHETAPTKLTDADRVLARKIAGWVE